MRLFTGAVVLLSVVCNKSQENYQVESFGCVTGLHTIRQVPTVIGCWHREVFSVRNSQRAVDSVSKKYGIGSVNVSVLDSFTNVAFELKPNCDCR